MSKIQYVQHGEQRTLDWTAAADMPDPKTVVVIGTQTGKPAGIGVAMTSALSGEVVAVEYNGGWRLPKASAAVIAQGDAVNWDVSEKKVDAVSATPAAGDVAGCGRCLRAAGNGDLWVDLDLSNPGTLT